MEITAQEIIALIRTTTIPNAATQFIDEDATFYEQGIDSLDALTILLKVEEVYAIDIPDDGVETLDSVNALVQYLNEHRVVAAQ